MFCPDCQTPGNCYTSTHRHSTPSASLSCEVATCQLSSLPDVSQILRLHSHIHARSEPISGIRWQTLKSTPDLPDQDIAPTTSHSQSRLWLAGGHLPSCCCTLRPARCAVPSSARANWADVTHPFHECQNLLPTGDASGLMRLAGNCLALMGRIESHAGLCRATHSLGWRLHEAASSTNSWHLLILWRALCIAVCCLFTLRLCPGCSCLT